MGGENGGGASVTSTPTGPRKSIRPRPVDMHKPLSILRADEVCGTYDVEHEAVFGTPCLIDFGLRLFLPRDRRLRRLVTSFCTAACSGWLLPVRFSGAC